MMNKVIIFTMKGCSACAGLKGTLNEMNISFQELPISEYRGIWEQVVKQTGLRNLPTIFIQEGDSESGPVYIPGRDFETEEEIINIIKDYV